MNLDFVIYHRISEKTKQYKEDKIVSVFDDKKNILYIISPFN